VCVCDYFEERKHVRNIPFTGHKPITFRIIDKHQHMHLTFNIILVSNVDFNFKTHKNT